MNLLQHQTEGINLAKKHNRWLYAWDTGTGKTLLGLALIKQRQVKTLVVAPKILLRDAWLGDARKFYPELAQQITDWHSIKNKRDKFMQLHSAAVLLINYESLLQNPDILTDYGFDMLILDESQKIKNYKARITKLILKSAINYSYIYLLSGTPAPNNDLEYYAQLRLLMPETVTNSWFKFRQEWFIPADRMGWKWRVNPKLRNDFKKLIASVSSVVKKEDVLDLHGQFFRYVEYPMSPTELKAYNTMKSSLLIEIDEERISAHQAVTKLMKLRQLLSGFAISDTGNVKEVGNSKLKTLKQFLELNPTEQYIIWTQYTHEAHQIKQMLKNDCALLIGETPDKERYANIKAFRERKVKYLVAHPKTIGHGTTFTNVNKAIYYSMSYSWEEFKQSQDRIYRYGQDKPVIYYVLLSEKKLLDWAIYKALEKKKVNADDILNYVKGVL